MIQDAAAVRGATRPIGWPAAVGPPRGDRRVSPTVRRRRRAHRGDSFASSLRPAGAVYGWLGFDIVADAVFRDLAIARIVEPTSKVDAARVLADLGADTASYRRIQRHLAKVGSAAAVAAPGPTRPRQSA